MKIVEAVNSMIINSTLISNVFKKENEIFFIYNKKYKWSVSRNENNIYFLYIYPKTYLTLEQLAYEVDYSVFDDFIVYRSDEIKTREAIETFAELYQVLSDKLFGVDDILDDIISDMPPF